MSLEDSDIHGSVGANFTFTVDTGTITKALLQAAGQPDMQLTLDASGQVVTVPGLPAGDSGVRLDIVWAPGDSDALVDVGTVISGTAQSAPAKKILMAGDTPGLVRLFGVGA